MKKTLIFITIIILLSTVTICASSFISSVNVSDMLSNIITPRKVASAINEIYATDDDVIVATINGIPIFKKEVEFSQFNNKNLLEEAKLIYANDSEALIDAEKQYSVEKEDIIKKIARRHVIIEDAKNYGIVFTHDDAMEYIANRESDLKDRAANGSTVATQTMLSDAELFEKLDMSKEMYEETILADTVIYKQTYLEAIRAYYMQVEGTDFIPYDEYIDNLLDKAELIIYDDNSEIKSIG